MIRQKHDKLRKDNNCRILVLCVFLLLSVSPGNSVAATDSLKDDFLAPPASCKPMTLWFWMNGHVSKEGITLDLEAMSRVGIGKALIFDGSSYLPDGPAGYMSPLWRSLLKHALQEGQRLGIEIGMHNSPGWSSSGGPWITPERSMKYLVWTEANVQGGTTLQQTLPRPQARLDYYRDARVIAFPSSPGQDQTPRIEDWSFKTNQRFRPGTQVTLPDASPVPGAVNPDSVEDLTAMMDPNGTLRWDAPEGDWTVLRMGYTTTGQLNVSASTEGTGLECDKLDPDAAEYHFQHTIGRVIEEVGPD
ncbi:MAG: hypothetical protein JW715_04460, partial [Sedimentisphaerales bacterium]|nr:hypothetical protein [Sedimentisphaerales bacterium]